MRTRIASCLAFSLILSGLSHAQELQGAKRVIDSTRETGQEEPVTPRSFAAGIGDFIKNSATLSPEDAAKGWLALLDAWDDAEIKRRVESLKKAWAGNEGALQSLTELGNARWPEDPGEAIARFRAELKKDEQERGISVPDLTGLPKEEAEELLFAAFETDADLAFTDDATRRIAVEAVLRNPKRLKKVAWSLVASSADGPLLEAMMPTDYAFPRDNYSAFHGMVFYFQYLVDSRSFEKADKIRKLLPEGSSGIQMIHGGTTPGGSFRRNMRDYLLGVLREDPSQSLWSDLGSFATVDDSEVWDFHRASLDGNRVVKAGDRRTVRSQWLDHLFGGGREEEGMEYLGKFIADSSGEELEEWLFKQVKTAHLMGDKATADAANDKLESVVKRDTANARFVEVEMERGRLVALEKIAAGWLKQALYSTSPWSGDEEPSILMQIYDAAGRPDDVLVMLDAWPRWSADDLSQVLRSRSHKTGIYVARALMAKGRNAEAVEILRELIKTNPADDDAYGQLLKLMPGEYESYLLDLSGKLPFQERPLIWLAQFYVDSGRLEEGETAIRKAIAIDPSDGEMGKIDRMRAYRVLGEIQRKQGKTEEAEFMAAVDRAIRLSEDADDWWEAGMTRRAVALYEQALGIFADAYCIQSRLALRYEATGDSENALKYYQRAFELMPDSFGRIESHCFGCEGAFRSPAAQGVAERVFTSLAAKPDAKAQVFYLLGYLRSSQGKSVEAVGYFRKALEKDPDYVNALRKLLENAQEGGLTSVEIDRANERLLELTGTANITNVPDLRRMWKTAMGMSARNAWMDPKLPLYPLEAARKDRQSRRPSPDIPDISYSSENRDNFRQSMTYHPSVRAIMQMMFSEQ